MSNDLSQLDQLIESDVLAALGQELDPSNDDMGDGLLQNVPEEYFIDEESPSIEENNFEIEEDVIAQDEETEGEVIDDIGDIEILPLAEIESALDEQEEEQIDISSNGNDLASILSKLLTNKTIEITIKIKD